MTAESIYRYDLQLGPFVALSRDWKPLWRLPSYMLDVSVTLRVCSGNSIGADDEVRCSDLYAGRTYLGRRDLVVWRNDRPVAAPIL